MEKEEIIKYGKILSSIISDYLLGKKREISLSKEAIISILNIAKENGILIVTYLSFKNEGILLPDNIKNKLEEYSSMNLRKTILFDEERKALYSFLEEKKIAYLPLKGIIINELYKDYGSREFADNDILFDAKYKKEIKSFFVSRGYEVEEYNKGVHDTYQKKPFYNFEMHRALFLDSNNDEAIKSFETYFKDYLSKGKKEGIYQRSLSKEDFFIYFMAHFYKHYIISGTGIRSLLDIFIYLRRNEDISFSYMDEEFKKIGLSSFVKEIISLANHLFLDEELSSKEQEIFLYMLSSGTYGSLETNVTNSIKKKGKIKYVLRRIFPPISFYKVTYPFFYKSKVLIPLAWLIRLIRAPFKSKEKIKEELKIINESDKR